MSSFSLQVLIDLLYDPGKAQQAAKDLRLIQDATEAADKAAKTLSADYAAADKATAEFGSGLEAAGASASSAAEAVTRARDALAALGDGMAAAEGGAGAAAAAFERTEAALASLDGQAAGDPFARLDASMRQTERLAGELNGKLSTIGAGAAGGANATGGVDAALREQLALEEQSRHALADPARDGGLAAVERTNRAIAEQADLIAGARRELAAPLPAPGLAAIEAASRQDLSTWEAVEAEIQRIVAQPLPAPKVAPIEPPKLPDPGHFPPIPAPIVEPIERPALPELGRFPPIAAPVVEPIEPPMLPELGHFPPIAAPVVEPIEPPVLPEAAVGAFERIDRALSSANTSATALARTLAELEAMHGSAPAEDLSARIDRANERLQDRVAIEDRAAELKDNARHPADLPEPILPPPEPRQPEERRPSEPVSAGGGFVETMMGFAEAAIGWDLIKGSYKGAAEAETLHAQMRAAKIPEGEIGQIDRSADSISRDRKIFTKNEVTEFLKDARTILGSTDHAIEAVPDVVRLATIAESQRPGQGKEGIATLLKGAETGGYTANIDKFHAFMNSLAKVTEVMGKTIDFNAWGQFFKYARYGRPAHEPGVRRAEAPAPHPGTRRQLHRHDVPDHGTGHDRRPHGRQRHRGDAEIPSARSREGPQGKGPLQGRRRGALPRRGVHAGPLEVRDELSEAGHGRGPPERGRAAARDGDDVLQPDERARHVDPGEPGRDRAEGRYPDQGRRRPPRSRQPDDPRSPPGEHGFRGADPQLRAARRRAGRSAAGVGRELPHQLHGPAERNARQPSRAPRRGPKPV